MQRAGSPLVLQSAKGACLSGRSDDRIRLQLPPEWTIPMPRTRSSEIDSPDECFGDGRHEAAISAWRISGVFSAVTRPAERRKIGSDQDSLVPGATLDLGLAGSSGEHWSC
jgi:hypothetical protein